MIVARTNELKLTNLINRGLVRYDMKGSVSRRIFILMKIHRKFGNFSVKFISGCLKSLKTFYPKANLEDINLINLDVEISSKLT